MESNASLTRPAGWQTAKRLQYMRPDLLGFVDRGSLAAELVAAGLSSWPSPEDLDMAKSYIETLTEALNLIGPNKEDWFICGYCLRATWPDRSYDGWARCAHCGGN